MIYVCISPTVEMNTTVCHHINFYFTFSIINTSAKSCRKANVAEIRGISRTTILLHYDSYEKLVIRDIRYIVAVFVYSVIISKTL